jgi:hypothetical protein
MTMAQEYMILVPELRQYHDLGASIGQFFQDDEADFLVRLLAVPVDPPMKK